MATLNVFELTNAELAKSLHQPAGKTKVKESVNKSKKAKKRTVEKFAANKIRVESLRFVEEAEDNDTEIDYTPEDDVVLVIDPEMEETPETAEDAEAAAEDLVGDMVCKCAICGANYVCDCDEVNEDLESEEGECPVCGETGEQIVIGEITPAEEINTDPEDEGEDDFEGEDEFEDEEFGDEDFGEDDFEDFDDEDDAPEDDEFEESLARAKARTKMRRESAKARTKKPVNRRASANTYELDEVTLNRMLTKFAKENYENARFVKITNAKCNGTKLTLEGTVVTKKGSKVPTKFVCENFKPEANIRARFTEQGPFTESAISKGTSFIVDFQTRNNTITPVTLKYSYKVSENRNVYHVSGKVLSENAKRTARK